ncbi:MAG TPA: 2-oxoglutarate dehydrogenase E1 component [Ktedonobacterales bacterium]|nr:2-oxoglutarate dehydrogenase E1 component [Ktedonobacterales bacterium]
MNAWDTFFGPNAGYAQELFERYQHDPTSVDAATRAFFERTAPPPSEAPAAPSAMPSAPTPVASVAVGAPGAQGVSQREIRLVVGTAKLARMIRQYGHLAARLDPLGSHPPGKDALTLAAHGLTEADLARLPASIVWPHGDTHGASDALQAMELLRALYSGSLGYEFAHIQDEQERDWLHSAVESGAFRQPLVPQERREVLRRLTQVEQFERFLHSTFVGQKRFSIEGMDALVPMLDDAIHSAAEAGTREVLIGMAHRGRLNVLAHVLGKPYAKIFSEFHTAPDKELVPSEGSAGINYGWTGDVKYHLGARKLVRESDLAQVALTLAPNPSHLEFVNPVVEGSTRAAQEQREERGAPTQNVDKALCITIHGDAAFPGEGVVAETLNLSRLAGYQTGGTLHIIANNQVGFTTSAEQGRSTLYASDLAKGFEIPIIHVNADDPEACLSATALAHAYRQRYHKDFLIDLVGYRRWGHNEGDEPAFTQPRLYALVAEHATTRALYAERLEAEDVVSAADVEAMQREAQERLKRAHDDLLAGHVPEEQATLEESPALASAATAAPADALRAYSEALLARPEGFTPNSKLERLLARRREAIEKPGGIDWGFAETLAFAAILADGLPIRLTGQDTERGTFSQRHDTLHDAKTGAVYIPLQALPQSNASFAVYNSPLSEAATLGFEYGYSVKAPNTLVLWEAQFGDFANAGQVLIDQFIAAARAKWRQLPGLVLLLPHGYEGQGPEHSSGRLERYLQLAAEDNLRVVNCTTAAQYFHLLRAQAKLLDSAPRPLIVMTPKSLLRHHAAGSSLSDLTAGTFQPVLVDEHSAPDAVRRLILCSGKVVVDLEAALAAQPEIREWIAVARVEQLYPYPEAELDALLKRYPQLAEVVWAQEEPHNMAAWSYFAPRLEAQLPGGATLRYVGRPERASTAEGLPEAHAAEQARIVSEALGGERPARMETRKGEYVS